MFSVQPADVRLYSRAPKYRITPQKYFFLDQRAAAIAKMFSGSRPLALAKIRGYLASRFGPRGEIEVSINNTFLPPFRAGRFNTSAFPALYTAKEIETCFKEISHRLKLSGVVNYDYVIFTVSVSGQLVDLRRIIAEGRWAINDDHGPCQTLAESLLSSGYEGVAAPSVRLAGGSCCALFQRSSVVQGDIVEVGTLNIS